MNRFIKSNIFFSVIFALTGYNFTEACINIKIKKLEVNPVDGETKCINVDYSKTGDAKFNLSLRLKLLHQLSGDAKLKINGKHGIFPLVAAVSLDDVFGDKTIARELKKCTNIVPKTPLKKKTYKANSCELDLGNLIPEGLQGFILGRTEGDVSIVNSDGDDVLTGSFDVKISRCDSK